MKSPFAIFRKHQRVMIVLLTGLAMFAFIFLDQLTQSGGEGLFPLIAIMMGAGIFWVIGTQRKQAGQYALAGAILGAVVGIALPRLSSAASSPVKTSAGNLSETQLQSLVRKRQAANSFVVSAVQKAYGEQPFMLQFILPQLQFSFGHPPDQIEEDVVFGYLLQHEADKLGMVVSDEAVTDFIRQATNDKLGEGDFREISRRLGLAGPQLYEVLRSEIKARQAFELLAPRTSSVITPEQGWQDFLKMNMSQSLEVTAVPVEAFTSEIAAPSDSELKRFFETYKERFAGDDPVSDPAFGQPRRMRVAYLEADYESVEASVPAVTDEEIEKFYEENKEALYRVDEIPGPSSSQSSTPGTGSVEESAGTEEKPLTPEFTPEKTPASDEKPEAGSEKKPEANKKPDAPADAAKPTENPEKKLESEAPAKPDASEKKVDDASPKKETPPKEDGQANNSRRSLPVAQQVGGTNTLLALAVANAFDDVETETTGNDAKPGEPAPPALPATKGRTQAPQLPNVPSAPAEGTPDGKPNYKPLDDILRGEIRDDLLTKRTLEAMEKRIAGAVASMEEIGFYANSPADDPDYVSPEEVVQTMKDFAEKNSLHYAETPLLSARKLADSDEYPIGKANNPAANPFQRSDTETVVTELFGTERMALYSPREAIDFFTNSRFAYWAMEDVEQHIPTFDEPGVKEQVLQAWKIQKARPKTEERANELAATARKAVEEGETIAKALSGTTVTGAEEGLQLTVHVTPPFSWFTRTQLSVPQQNPLQMRNQPPLELSTILGGQVENVGNDFMRAIFQGLDDGEVGVVPNEDVSVFYVVQARDRKPSTADEIDSLRKLFFSAKQTFSRELQYLAQIEQQQATYEWSQKFRADHNWDGKIHRPKEEEQ